MFTVIYDEKASVTIVTRLSEIINFGDFMVYSLIITQLVFAIT